MIVKLGKYICRSITDSLRRKLISMMIGFALVGANINVAFAGNIAAGPANFSPNAIGGVYAFGATTIQYSKFKGYPNGRVDPGVASNSGVRGILLSYYWNAIETSDGVYNWSQVDNEVGLAASAGKVVSLSIAAGAFAPGWLYSEGASSFNIVWDKGWGFTPCTNMPIPIPWDSVFLAKWGAFVAALGARYDSNPTVVSVKLTGFNSETAELFLPASVNKTITLNGANCVGPNYVTQWQAAGYTRTLAEYAFNTIEADFAAAFPNTPFEAMKGPADFPPIDQNGNIMPKTDGEDDQANTDVINAAITNYGQQFVLQNDGLSATWSWALETSYAGQLNTGYQMVSNNMNSQLPPAISNAVANSGDFLEISTPDIDNPLETSAISWAAAALPY